jgi:hypothetical protein
MKGEAIARQGFCDVYQENNRSGFSRPHVSIDWRKQSASASVLRAIRQETAQVEDCHLRWFVQPSANCRNLAVASAIAESSFQLLTSGASIAI